MISVLLKVTISITVALVVATLLVRTSAPLYANIAASFANLTPPFLRKSGVQQAGTTQSMPPETLTAADKKPSAPNNVASAPADQVAEKVDSQSDVLFRQFQAWAAAQANATRAQPDQEAKVTRSAPAKLTEGDSALRPVVQKRKNRPVVLRNAPTKMSLRNPQKQPRPLQNARAQVIRARTARAQEPDQNPLPKPDIH